jgi:hypothetical protein
MGRAVKNYPRELKDRAMAMVREVRGDYTSEYAAKAASIFFAAELDRPLR